MKKFISLFLIFSLIMLSANLHAKERRGAELIVTKNDGLQIRGELITVKPNSLLLLDTEGKDVSIDIADIKVIRIVKKSKALLGAGVGAIVLGSAFALFIATSTEIDESDVPKYTLLFGAIGAGFGALIGVIAGAGADKIIHIEGMSDSEIKEAMDKLRKKARIRDYK